MYERYQVRASIEKRERHWPLRSEPMSILRSHRFRSLRLKTTIVSRPLVRDIQAGKKKESNKMEQSLFLARKNLKIHCICTIIDKYLFFFFF